VSAELVANLESPLPASLPVGTGTALYLSGTCFHRRARIADLAILVDGARHRPAAFRMPRPDVFDGDAAGFRSGFWATVPIAARAEPDAIELALAARPARGTELRVPLGQIEIVPAEPRARVLDPGLIAVCMATYEPEIALFRRQVESLRSQTDRRWVCVISDDCSSMERWERLRAVVAGDPRFVASRSERRRGFYGNFERALTLAPPHAALLALCDQDDVWLPEKLAVLRAAIGSAQMVYSDQRLVDAEGRVLRDTLWEGRRNNHTDIASLLIANTITGAATLFRREVADLALPFPDAPGVQFHDHWLGLVALASGDVAYVDRPLYDYVQHGRAVFGEVAGDRGRRRGVLRGGRGAYFLGYAMREVQAQALLVRCDGKLTGAKRRALRRYVAAARSPVAFAWLALRPLRALAGCNETLGSEADLVRGIVWRWLVAVLATGARRPGRRPCDARFPDEASFEQRRLSRWRARA
jgi:glycosyltransferase involved in cell wall biosynthesis